MTEKSSCLSTSDEQKSKSKDKPSTDHTDYRDHKCEVGEKKMDCKVDQDHGDHRESDADNSNDTDVTKDSEDDSDSEDNKCSKLKNYPPVRSASIAKKSDSGSLSSIKPTSTSSYVTPSSSSSTSQTLSKFVSQTSVVKKQAAERKMKARASHEPISSEGESENEEDMVSSEFEDSDDEIDVEKGKPDLREEILTFFQNGTIDELSLIAGCSVKKAQRIVELRPYKTWESLVRTFFFCLSFLDLNKYKNLHYSRSHSLIFLLITTDSTS